MKNLLYTKTWRVLVMVAVVALTMTLASCDNRKEEKSLAFDEMYAQFIAQEEFKSSSFDQQDQMLQEWLEEAENNGYIHHLDKNNAGYIHICIKVDSKEKFEEILAKVKAANYEILYEPATVGGTEFRAICFEDNIIEVCY